MAMGLSIVRTIVEHHHGRIWAENQADAGAVFRVRFPPAKHPHGDGLSQKLARPVDAIAGDPV